MGGNGAVRVKLLAEFQPCNVIIAANCQQVAPRAQVRAVSRPFPVGVGWIGHWTEVAHRRKLIRYPNYSGVDWKGIRPHDHIPTIGGYPAVDRDGYSQSFLLNGPSGSSVALTVQPHGGAARGLDLPRETLPAVDLVDQRLLPNAAGKKIGYLLIPTFFSTSIDAQIRRSVRELMAAAGGKLDGLVIDMRINSGGSIALLTSTLGLFTKGPIGKFSARKKALARHSASALALTAGSGLAC